MMVQAIHSLSLLLVLLTAQGAASSEWNVMYSADICAVENSSVNISCSYTYPSELTIEEVFWTIDKRNKVNLKHNAKYTDRIQANCRKKTNCTLHIRRVGKEDEADRFYCRITTPTRGETWLGESGVRLHITDLIVRGPKIAKVGEHVTLTCNNTCPPNINAPFIWSKDGRPVEKKQSTNNQLQLHPVSRGDEGRYTCAVRGHEKLPSPPFRLKVHYPPRNTTMSVTPSTEKMKGDSVTLTCSSDANPAVKSYTWFKVDESTPVGSGQQYNITNMASKDSGQYYCEARNTVGTDRSTAVSITVSAEGKGMSIYVLMGLAVCGLVILFLAVLWMRCWKENRKKTEENDEDQSHYANVGLQRSTQSQAALTPSTADNPLYSNAVLLRSGQSRATASPSAKALGRAQDDALCSNAVLLRSAQGRATASPSAKATGRAPDDALYSNIQPRHVRQIAKGEVQYLNTDLLSSSQSRTAGPPSARAVGGGDDDDQYSTIQPQRSRETAGGQEDDDVQYSTIQPQRFRETAGGQEEDEEDDDDVQYSTIQPQRSRETAEGQEDDEEDEEDDDDDQYSTIQPHCFRETAEGQEDDVHYASVQLKRNENAKGVPAQRDENNPVIYSAIHSQD